MAAMLSTIDNPYNPVTNFDDWYRYDMLYGVNCCGYLARIAHTSDQLTDEENDKIIEDAIDEIISLHKDSEGNSYFVKFNID